MVLTKENLGDVRRKLMVGALMCLIDDENYIVE